MSKYTAGFYIRQAMSTPKIASNSRLMSISSNVFYLRKAFSEQSNIVHFLKSEISGLKKELNSHTIFKNEKIIHDSLLNFKTFMQMKHT